MNKDQKTRLAHSLLAGLVIIHVILAIAYAKATPYRTSGFLAVFQTRPHLAVPDIGAPDERQHANYVIGILNGEGLPVYKVWADPGHTIRNPYLAERYEDHQPPLFYLVAACYAKITGLDAASASDPERGVRLRYVNALFGAITVVGVFFLAFWGLGRRDVALLASAITALLPMHVALSGAVSNDPLLFAICTWTLVLCIVSVKDSWTTSRSLAIGGLIALGLLTKTTALALFPIVILCYLLSRPPVVQLLSVLASSLALSAPLFVRNTLVYGDPLGLKSFKELFADALPTSAFISQISETPFNHWFNYVGWWTARSFFGVFGYMDVFLNERGVAYTGPATSFGPSAPNTLYRLLLALAAIASLGFLLSVLDKRADRSDQKVHVVNGAFLLVITGLFVLYNISFFQGQARYFYPAIGPIAVGLSLGAIYLAKSRRIWVIGAIVALLAVLNIYALSRLPAEFAKRINPNLANQLSDLRHPMYEGSRVVMRPDQTARRLDKSRA